MDRLRPEGKLDAECAIGRAPSLLVHKQYALSSQVSFGLIFICLFVLCFPFVLVVCAAFGFSTDISLYFLEHQFYYFVVFLIRVAFKPMILFIFVTFQKIMKRAITKCR